MIKTCIKGIFSGETSKLIFHFDVCLKVQGKYNVFFFKKPVAKSVAIAESAKYGHTAPVLPATNNYVKKIILVSEIPQKKATSKKNKTKKVHICTCQSSSPLQGTLPYGGKAFHSI